jgi:hypothetical protein
LYQRSTGLISGNWVSTNPQEGWHINGTLSGLERCMAERIRSLGFMDKMLANVKIEMIWKTLWAFIPSTKNNYG